MPKALKRGQLRVLKRSDIVRKNFSDMMVMPGSDLNTCQRDEILDLRRFLESRGGEKSP